MRAIGVGKRPTLPSERTTLLLRDDRLCGGDPRRERLDLVQHRTINATRRRCLGNAIRTPEVPLDHGQQVGRRRPRRTKTSGRRDRRRSKLRVRDGDAIVGRRRRHQNTTVVAGELVERRL